MKDDRRLEVLRAIISQYVATSEPVSSKAVAEAKALGVSSATIRNDMGALEEAGLITQPHVSAGRIPTEAGYRLYVDSLPKPDPLDEAQRAALRLALFETDDLSDAVSKTVRFLSRLTRQTAVVEYPVLSTAKVRRVELVDLDFSRLLVIVVASTGEVSEKQLEVPDDISMTDDARSALRDALNGALAGASLTDVEGPLDQFLDAEGPHGELGALVSGAVSELVAPAGERKIVTSGTAHLARAGIEFSDVAGVLEALEDQAVLLRVLREVHTQPIHVSIGRENRHPPLAEPSLVSARYSAPPNLGTHIGATAPTRMDYSKALGAVEAVSQYLGHMLVEQFGFSLNQAGGADEAASGEGGDAPEAGSA